MSNRGSVAVVLPAYNEEETIEAVIRDFNKFLPDAEIIVVNNNSSDRTADIAQSVLEELNVSSRRVLNEVRQGKGYAVRRAFLEVDADIVIMADADTTYPASQAEELIKHVSSGEYDIVIGDRLSNGSYGQENKRSFHGFGNKLVAWLINRIFNASLKDILSGYRVFSRRYVKNYPILAKGFEIETEMTLHTLDKRLAIKEVPIEYSDRPEGSYSKLNTFSDGFKVIYTIFQILRFYKPLLFFSATAVFFLMLGLIAGVPVITEFVKTGAILAIPKAILATGLMLLSGLMLTIGLVLDSIARIHRFDFELTLLGSKRL